LFKTFILTLLLPVAGAPLLQLCPWT